MQHLLNKKTMAKSCGVSVSAFDKWGVEPARREGREAFYDVASVLRNRLLNAQLRQAEPEPVDADDEELLKARIRLTNAQADMQELKTKRKNGKVIDTEFIIWALSRLAGEISSILDGLPLTMDRAYPNMPDNQLERLRKEIAKASNRAAGVGERLPELAAEYITTYQSEQA